MEEVPEIFARKWVTRAGDEYQFAVLQHRQNGLVLQLVEARPAIGAGGDDTGAATGAGQVAGHVIGEVHAARAAWQQCLRAIKDRLRYR